MTQRGMTGEGNFPVRRNRSQNDIFRTNMKFEWDNRKAARNFEKHRVAFAEAASVFDDALSITIYDPDHSKDEER